jgi:hypothetical protein
MIMLRSNRLRSNMHLTMLRNNILRLTGGS